uniref:Uncharacterized protein n=1 Tax=Helianthus annuus TaxID=4232 RepID=A0A251VKU2_HELAN
MVFGSDKSQFQCLRNFFFTVAVSQRNFITPIFMFVTFISLHLVLSEILFYVLWV